MGHREYSTGYLGKLLSALWFFCELRKLLFVIFSDFEDRRLLNGDSEIYIYCLHQVYIPLIQQYMDEFIVTWNNHSLRTEPGNPSPINLYIIGLNLLRAKSEETGENFTELIQVRNLRNKLFVSTVRYSFMCFIGHGSCNSRHGRFGKSSTGCGPSCGAICWNPRSRFTIKCTSCRPLA